MTDLPTDLQQILQRLQNKVATKLLLDCYTVNSDELDTLDDPWCSWKKVAAAIKGDETLKTITFGEGAKGCALVFEALKGHSKLATLFMEWSDFGESPEVDQLAETSLSIASCKLAPASHD